MALTAPNNPFLRCEIEDVRRQDDGTYEVSFTGAGENEVISRDVLDKLRRNPMLSQNNRDKLFAALTA